MIGKYRDADRSPLSEPAAAMIQAESAIAEANAMAGRATGTATVRKVRMGECPSRRADSS